MSEAARVKAQRLVDRLWEILGDYTLAPQSSSYQRRGDVLQAIEDILDDHAAEQTATLRAENARLTMKLEQYQQQLDDRWAGVVGVTNKHVEQTAALRAEVEWFRDVVSEYFGYDAPGGSAINPLPEKLQEWRRETAALRAALNVLLQPDVTRCASERCGECAACHARAVLAAPEAAP